MEDIILECSQRETDRDNFPTPGEYTTTLAKNTFIYPGDQVTVSKTFIDTQAETSGVISVDDDTTIRMDWGIYTQNWFGQSQLKPITAAPNDPGEAAIEFNTNYGYIFSERTKNENGKIPPLMINIYALHAYPIQLGSQANGAAYYWGDPTNDPGNLGKKGADTRKLHPVQFTYLDQHSQQQTHNFDIPLTVSGAGHGINGVRVPVNILCQWDSLDQFKPYQGRDPTQPDGGGWATNYVNQHFDTQTPCLEFQYTATGGGGATNPPAKYPAPGSAAHVSSYVKGTNWYGSNGGDEGGSGAYDYCVLVEFTDANDEKDFLSAPKTFSKTFVIPEGKYLPADICDFFNKKMDDTDNPLDGGFAAEHQSNNQLLFLSQDLKNAYGGTESDYLFVSETGKPVPSAIRMNDFRWVGTNQFELQYNTTDQHFYWNYLHMPIYSQSNPVTCLAGSLDPAVGNRLFEVRRNGGIFFTDLESTAIDKDTKQAKLSRFFSEKLGFVLSDLIPPRATVTFDKTEPNDVALNGGVLAAVPPPAMETNSYVSQTYALDIGKYTTAASSKLDSIVPKGAGNDVASQVYTNGALVPFTQGFSNANISPIKFPLQNTFASNINQVIKATNPAVSGELLDSGYYLLEMRAGLRTQVMDTTKTHTMISGIINRYYSLGSYTSTGVDETLTYIHKGEIMSLSNIDIRVLTPQKQLAKIGFDNSIFVYVKRGALAQSIGQPQPPPGKQAPPQQKPQQ